MKIIAQEAKVWGECPTNKDEAILWIERAGRICYRSEDKIVKGSGEKFVNNIIKRKHLSVIEHSNLVVRLKEKSTFPKQELRYTRGHLDSNFFDFAIKNDYIYVAGNYRAWMERIGTSSIDEMFGFLKEVYVIVTDPDDIPVDLKKITVEFLTDRAVTHELVRHRVASYSQESQRYCAYKDELEVILPVHYTTDFINKSNNDNSFDIWKQTMEDCEKAYKQLLKNGKRAEQARDVLPNSTATRIIMTASVSEWKHVFKLRTAKTAYPGIVDIMLPVEEEFKRSG